ncbi:hypothetical protein F511_34726 [Dorcoceras hygrometricum]|uniref:Uncharacterized protein n=1 Tax=Dorcoceras hygrometricum TaxID=472368 RepID=A0A2Z7B585_9LAMI|nr:hypothetical protein F511_34726 [Dorcoceras hygrometricum]
MAETEDEPGIEVRIEHGVRSRLQHFKDQADSLTLESVRRLLEKDLGLEKFALDAHKRFIRQYLEKQMDDADNCDSKTASDVDKDNQLSDKEDALLPKQPERKKESTKSTPDDKEMMEDSPILGVLSPKSEAGAQTSSLSESTIKKAIWERADHFLANSESITLVGVRRLLEEDLGLDKNTLDPFKKYISQQIDQVLNPPKGAKAAKDIKISSKNSQSKKSGKTSGGEGSDSLGDESDSMEDKAKSRKEAAHRKNKKLEEVKKRKRSTEGDLDASSKKQNNLAKRHKEEDSEPDDAGNVSEDGRSKTSIEKPRNEKPISGYGRKVEHLKSVIKACGMSVAPSIYKKAKQVSDEKREAFIVKELEGILLKEGLSKDPSEKEIKDCRKRKETAKELEGIDMSNIISSTRRRSTFSFVPPPKFETRPKGDKVGAKDVKKKEKTKKDQNDDNEGEAENKKEQEEVEKKAEDEQTFEKEDDEEEDKNIEDDDEEEAEDEEDEEDAEDDEESEEFIEDAFWQMNPRSREQIEPGSYPVREDEPDCSYYIRTGLCRFGATCRFNHPPNRKLAIATARMRGEYPERIGQPECQYYLKTGTCKFGSTCKFHHPIDKAGIAGRVALNVLGYPLRPNEVECAYFMRNGQCKFGSTCKFHHPQPSNMMVPLRGSSIYPPIHSPTAGQLSFPLSRASFIPSSQWQNPSSYTPMVVPQAVLSVPGWNLYTMGSVSSSENRRPTAGSSLADGASPQGEAAKIGSQFRPGTLQLGQYAFQRDNVFPERLGQPECQFYMKTGDCKFGAVCKFHHPRERLVPVPDCVLSPLGLPLRPGEPLCVFYSRYGICKFGPSCKFDHPMRAFAYNTAASSSLDPSAVRHFLASTGAVALSLTPDGLVEARQKPPGDINIDSE